MYLLLQKILKTVYFIEELWAIESGSSRMQKALRVLLKLLSILPLVQPEGELASIM